MRRQWKLHSEKKVGYWNALWVSSNGSDDRIVILRVGDQFYVSPYSAAPREEDRGPYSFEDACTVANTMLDLKEVPETW